ALDLWAYAHGSALHFIAPGNRFRDECLNESWFRWVSTWRRSQGASRRLNASASIFSKLI
ncbi:MAG TPA: hypothetical protein VKB63_08020, partial [Gemmatimonadales bacterium]|nr:hypothetical protein [Gemmatimonadales bacterium]